MYVSPHCSCRRGSPCGDPAVALTAVSVRPETATEGDQQSVVLVFAPVEYPYLRAAVTDVTLPRSSNGTVPALAPSPARTETALAQLLAGRPVRTGTGRAVLRERELDVTHLILPRG